MSVNARTMRKENESKTAVSSLAKGTLQRRFLVCVPCLFLNHVSAALLRLVNSGLKNEAWDTGRESARLSNVFQWEPICFQSLKHGFFSLHLSLSLIQLPIFNFAWNQNWNYSTNIQWTLSLCQVLIQALGSQQVSPVSLISGVCNLALQDQGSTINTSSAWGSKSFGGAEGRCPETEGRRALWDEVTGLPWWFRC